MEQNKELYTLQLMRYLIFSKGYLRVSISMGPGIPEDKDVWLVNADAPYDVIHISDDSEQTRKAKNYYVETAFKKIRSFVSGSEQGDFLDISLNSEALEYQVGNIQYIYLYPGCQLNGKVEMRFPELNKVIYDVENVQQEKKKLEREIMLLAVGQGRQHEKGELKSRIKEKATASFIIIGSLCLIIFLAIHILSRVFESDTTTMAIALGAYYKAFIVILNQWYRLLTSGFVHISPLHLLCNLFSLWQMSSTLEKQFGFKKSMLILLTGIIAGNAAEFVAGPNQVCVGLSGGLFAALGALTVIYIRNGYFKSPTFRGNYLSLMYVNTVISLMPNVSWVAHLSGFIIGGFLAVLLDSGFEKALRINIAVCMLILTVFTGYLGYRNFDFRDFYYGTDVKVASVYRRFGLDGLARRIETETYNYYRERN